MPGNMGRQVETVCQALIISLEAALRTADKDQPVCEKRRDAHPVGRELTIYKI
jgi:hypothetical protein